ncbi:hypothetical protein EP073_02350 [Geovibrio thiophilus]|uniref:D,L-carboxypeptidase peptidase domain-containing protein n=1 Tax=Geovibrio thiophilus TaxID=139438 RepID=A0A3R5Y5M9_9BACT|nr:M99 family carboxypeptidase catalytic domain-containing protein [Geovibrio thiophilus]QAR32277.1 hypothetical protein EP073_02350 [Geovibrio thiophilus]
MKKTLTLFILLFAAAMSFAQTRPYIKNEVYFKGTEYELDVYRIYGRQDGKTMLIIGGIQGDEPGGFLSADLYAEMRLEKGNLIVVPRANFKSVILFDRETEADMNRRFTKDLGVMEMDKVVEVIISLMEESDVFLNLHDGWGYHNPKYIDQWRNPARFGQSIITDADVFTCDDGSMLDLKTPAKKVLEAVNRSIGEEQYFMHYFNTKTEDPLTKFTDMRKTATYYALKHFCLPSFGVESSKNLPSVELKVLYHNYVVNEFMKYYDIVPEHPRIFLKAPQLNYAVIRVNDEVVTVENGKTLYADRGDIIEITNVDANYDRGISCDILGMGDLNDCGKRVEVKGESRIVFRKDNQKMGEIRLSYRTKTAVSPAKPQPRVPAPSGEENLVPSKTNVVFVMKVNGIERSVASGSSVKLKKTDTIEFIEALGGDFGSPDVPVNVKGYVPSGAVNSGDDRGYKIRMTDYFMLKYSRDGKGKAYPVIAGNSRNEIGGIWLEIE